MKYNIYNLVVEVGRKCNMKCTHCLRGEPEDVTVDLNSLFKFLKDEKINYINSITFTGGEPTLYAKEIISIIDFIMKNNIEIYGFYIASNGLIVNLELMMKLVQFRAYISSKCCLDDEDYICRYDISDDHFHDGIHQYNIDILKGFSFVRMRGDIDEAYLIDQGRASIYHHTSRTVENTFYANICGDYTEIETVYFNAKGQILWNCDLSYETQEFCEPLSINEYSFSEIVNMEMCNVQNN